MGATLGVISMKKTMTFAILAGSALALAACSGETAKAPEEAVMAEETPAATSDAAGTDEELDPTGNPIGPDAPMAADSMAAEPPAAE